MSLITLSLLHHLVTHDCSSNCHSNKGHQTANDGAKLLGDPFHQPNHHHQLRSDSRYRQLPMLIANVNCDFVVFLSLSLSLPFSHPFAQHRHGQPAGVRRLLQRLPTCGGRTGRCARRWLPTNCCDISALQTGVDKINWSKQMARRGLLLLLLWVSRVKIRIDSARSLVWRVCVSVCSCAYVA